jgi:glycosyltransferase involved in cell wall biosynthesis
VFILIGDGPERHNLELQIKENGLENKVLILGRIPEAYKYLPAFDVFVLPSVKEGFPWAVLEAMSAKLPIIATDVGANPEVIENHKNGFLVKPGKPEEICSALKQIMEKDNIRKEMGFQAHQTVVFKFDLNKMVGQIESLL